MPRTQPRTHACDASDDGLLVIVAALAESEHFDHFIFDAPPGAAAPHTPTPSPSPSPSPQHSGSARRAPKRAPRAQPLLVGSVADFVDIQAQFIANVKRTGHRLHLSEDVRAKQCRHAIIAANLAAAAVDRRRADNAN